MQDFLVYWLQSMSSIFSSGKKNGHSIDAIFAPVLKNILNITLQWTSTEHPYKRFSGVTKHKGAFWKGLIPY